MKKLILVRHCQYCSTSIKEDPPTADGLKNIALMSNKLKQLINPEETIIIFSSPAVRNIESAKIIAEKLKTSFKEEECLWSDALSGSTFNKTWGLIDSVKNNFDVIILVVHQQHTSSFQREFIWNELKIELKEAIFGEAEAVLIDCEKETSQVITYKE